jgi:hypothetical protein
MLQGYATSGLLSGGYATSGLLSGVNSSFGRIQTILIGLHQHQINATTFDVPPYRALGEPKTDNRQIRVNPVPD